MEECLFCDRDNHKPGKNCDYVCGSCVQLLLSGTQDDLGRSYKKATDLGLKRKAFAIRMFIEERYETKKSKRNMVRARPKRAIRPTPNQIRAQSAVV